MTLQNVLEGSYRHRGTRGGKPGDSVAFKIDDRNTGDMSISFCDITLTLPQHDADEFELELRKVPWNDEVEDVADDLDGQWEEILSGEFVFRDKELDDWDDLGDQRQEVPLRRVLRCHMTIKSAPAIRKLAKAIRKVTGRYKTYDDPNWKWVTRRTTDSLDQFAAILAEAYRTHRKMKLSGPRC